MRRKDYCVMVLVSAYPGVRGARGVWTGLRAAATDGAKVNGIFGLVGLGGMVTTLKGCFL
jgi:hypothetical protein